MIIDAFGCSHGHIPKLKGGDILIVTGDMTARDTREEHMEFDKWLRSQYYDKIIVIAGNHDKTICGDEFWTYSPKITYLEDNFTTYKELKIWGSPWSLKFEGINPKCTAFTGTEFNLKEKFDLIPSDIDILITHTPPFRMLDFIDKNGMKVNVGSFSLQNSILLNKFPKLKHHFFSHIHECGGESTNLRRTGFHNVSIMDENYRPINEAKRIHI